MFQIFFLLIFQSFYTSQILGSDHCNYYGTSKSYLDAAVDFINKAKSCFPESVTIPEEKTYHPMDCEEVLKSGHNHSGVYTVWPRNRLTDGKPLEVYCDMDTDGGGWTLIQRRGNFNRSVDYFYKDWSSYKNGFGDIREDFWLGNDNIFAFTNQRMYSIQFDLKDVDEEKRHALYDIFWIDNEDHKYKLHIADYSGDAGDSMIPIHVNQNFSTKDQDNDSDEKDNCAERYNGAWWYQHCHLANLNGLYLRGPHDKAGSGVSWHSFKGPNLSLDTTEMKIRPMNFKRKLIAKGTP